MLRIIGLIIAITGIMVGIGSNLPIFIDPASLIIVVICTLGMLLLGGHSIPTMFGAVFSGEATIDELRKAARAWKMVRWYLLAAGFMGTLLGWAIMLKLIDDLAAIGPGVAISILTVFYAIFLAFFISLPLQSRLEERIGEQAAPASSA